MLPVEPAFFALRGVCGRASARFSATVRVWDLNRPICEARPPERVFWIAPHKETAIGTDRRAPERPWRAAAEIGPIGPMRTRAL